MLEQKFVSELSEVSRMSIFGYPYPDTRAQIASTAWIQRV